MRRKQHEPEKENNERWLLTYSDLITLLMIFFIVMYTLSKVDATKFQAMAESLNAAIGGGTPAKMSMQTQSGQSLIQFNTGGPQTTQPDQLNPAAAAAAAANAAAAAAANAAETRTLQGIKQQIDQFIKASGLQAKVNTSIQQQGLVVRISNTLLFASGSAAISPEAHSILVKLSTILSTLHNYIRVEGNTDNLPINTPQYPSNWELSTARAVNVLEVLAAYGVSPNELSATGYGEYRPIVPNTSDANREENRRVDLVILRNSFDATEVPVTASASTTTQATGGASFEPAH